MKDRLEYSTGELLTMNAFTDHHDKGHSGFNHYAVLEGLNPFSLSTKCPFLCVLQYLPIHNSNALGDLPSQLYLTDLADRYNQVEISPFTK